ncbi:MAG: hypothetical protein NTY53_01595, partial [Kiritimatiellaeota bacterium]|nr:hypothetical protein [Kiritimatiellota bacterium]
MHMTIHPSHWFHHEAMQGVQMPSGSKLRQVLHAGAFWAIVVLIAMFCAAFALALFTSGTIGNDSSRNSMCR